MMSNQQPAGEAQNSQTKEWYKNWWGIILAILFLPFFAIWFIWAKTNWNKTIKAVVTFLVLIISIIAISSDDPETKDKQIQPAQQQQANQEQPTQEVNQETQVPQVATKKIPYEVADEWSIPNGGKGRRIVISADYLNESDMTLLGETLKEDTEDERNAIIMVHTDKKSAQIQKDSSMKMTEDQLNYVGKHYIGQYTRNANSNINEFADAI